MHIILITSVLLYLIISLFVVKSHLFERMAITILISLGIYGIVPFLVREYLEIPYSQSPNIIMFFVTVIFVLVTIIFIYSRGVKSYIDALKVEKINKLELLFLAVALIAIIRGYFVPVRGWDAYSLYDSRGRFYEYGVKQSEMGKFSDYDEANSAYYFSYPPMTSSIHAVLYSLGFQSPTFIYTTLYFTLIIFIYLYAKSHNFSLFNMFLVISPVAFGSLMMGQVYSSYTNLPMLCFQIGAVYFSLRFYRSGKYAFIVISSLLLGFSNWTRAIEPTYISFLLFSIFLIFVTKYSNVITKIIAAIFFAVVSVAPRIIWSTYVLITSGANSEISPSVVKMISSLFDSLYLNNMMEVAFFVYRSLFSLQGYITLFIVIVCILCLVNIKKLEEKVEIYSLAILIASLYLIMILGTLYFSVTFVWWKEIPGSFLRSNLVLIPLIMLMSIKVLKNIKIGK